MASIFDGERGAAWIFECRLTVPGNISTGEKSAGSAEAVASRSSSGNF